MKTGSKMKTTLKMKTDHKIKTTAKIKMTQIWWWPKYEDNQNMKTSKIRGRPKYGDNLKLTKTWSRGLYPAWAYTTLVVLVIHRLHMDNFKLTIFMPGTSGVGLTMIIRLISVLNSTGAIVAIWNSAWQKHGSLSDAHSYSLITLLN